ncbi:MAG: LPS export ABC transporter permease LptF [Terracidiphilus sp.]
MRTLTRYIFGEIFSHTLIGCALFTFILFMPQLPRILEVVVRNSSTLTDMLEVFLFTLPNLFKVTIPMAVLVGILLGFSRMAADSEIVAMRASGLGIGYFARVASIVAVGGTLLGLVNSLYLAPRANQAILQMEHQLETSQASYEIQPRVFYEDFKNFVLYVQDVRSGVGAANWRKVFMANVADPANPVVTTAASATVVSDSPQELLMRLRDGAEHETTPGQPDQSKITAFTSTVRPLELNAQGDVHLGRMDTAIYALPTSALLQRIHGHGPDARRILIELHNRFSYPAACLVLMLIGVPLGAASRRGGKSSGFVVALLLVSLYYFLSTMGIALGRQGKLPVFFAVWSANLLFAAAGLFLLWQMATGGRVLNAIVSWTARAPRPAEAPAAAKSNGSAENGTAQNGKIHGGTGRNGWGRNSGFLNRLRVHPLRAATGGAYPRLLDTYVVREFLKTFSLVLAGFILLMLIFTFFDLMSDILRNHIGLPIVGDYLVNLTPSMLYQLAPLAVLIAVLVTFGVLNRNSEIVAMKATGISLYRLVIPIVSIAAVLAVALFLFDQYYLPQANQRQEALRNIIKGRPAQTYLHPEEQWIFGEPARGEPGRIFYYKFFDPVRNEFANLSVFEFNPSTFQLTRRIFAARVYWDADSGAWRFQNGWASDFSGPNVTGFREFRETTFPEIHEDPGYFNVKEDMQAQEMNFGQLRSYIHDLRQSGFDTMPLRVALWHKLAYPLIAVVMAILAIPFALSMGRRGSVTAIAVAVGVALAYWVIDGLLGDMGNVNFLPAILAAWSSDVLFGLVGGYLLLRTPT